MCCLKEKSQDSNNNEKSVSYLTTKDILNIRIALSFMPGTQTILFYRDIIDKLYDRSKANNNNNIYLDERIDASSNGLFFKGKLSQVIDDIMASCESFEESITKARKILSKEVIIDL